MTPRYLTKSRFKLARECPTKLFYIKKEKYYDNKVDNDFLKALAEGGFQVGELAKRYFPDGVDIEDLDYEKALEQTAALMGMEDAIIYEAAFRHEDLFIRADIIVKRNNKLHLIEVKAKSIDSTNNSFAKKDGGIKADWKPYLEDIAFQKYVVQKAYPALEVRASLMLTDKTTTASVDGLNQMFLLYQHEGRNSCKYQGPENLEALGQKILALIPVDDEISHIYADKTAPTFEEAITIFSEKYKVDQEIAPIIGAQCGKCEFRLDNIKEDILLKSGFHECWNSVGVANEDLQQPHVLDLWYFLKKDDYIKKGIYFLKDLTREDLEPKKPARKKDELPKSESFLSRIDRQELQINKCRECDNTHYLDKEGLKEQMSQWKFPLHFIDFETTAVAIPFNKGRRPYEQIAFQFSHHVMLEDGTIKHTGEWISNEVGKFPNFDFIRSLKKELENDEGTIFRYSNHENSILNAIYRQLKESAEKDKEELCEWIKTITASSSSSADKWEGHRTMVDLLEMVKRYYYDPLMKGSNSIKTVLPSILKTSKFLQEKYSQPIYGKEITSINFTLPPLVPMLTINET